jgi:hypothetical protein
MVITYDYAYDDGKGLCSLPMSLKFCSKPDFSLLGLPDKEVGDVPHMGKTRNG